MIAPDPAFAWHRLNDVRGDEALYESIIAARKSQTAKLTAPLAARLRAGGATALKESWLVPRVFAVSPPSVLRRMLIANPALTVSFLDGIVTESLTINPGFCLGPGVDNVITRQITKGKDANSYLVGGRVDNGRARLGIIEVGGDSPIQHAGFLSGPPGGGCAAPPTSRFAVIRDCSNGCIPYGGPFSTSPQHGSWVTEIAAGDLENGQIPSVGEPQAAQYSGISPEAKIYFYGAPGPVANAIQALEAAVQDGVDTINMSFAANDPLHIGTECAYNANPGGMNLDLRNAALAGITLVASAGNGRPDTSSACSAGYPAVRRDVIAMGALGSTVPYDLAPWSAQGGMDVFAAYPDFNYAHAFAVVDLIAPGERNFTFGTPPISLNPGGCFSGTSFSAPVGSGLVTNLRQSLRIHDISHTFPTDAYSMIAHFLLSGAGNAVAHGGYSATGIDPPERRWNRGSARSG